MGLIAIANPSKSSSIVTLVVEAETDGVAIFHFRETDQPVNSSVCYIASLKVYRGREQATEISHKGFSLSSNGTIEVCLKFNGMQHDVCH